MSRQPQEPPPPGQLPASVASLLDDFAQLQAYASRIQRVISSAEQAAPPSATGRDATGAAEATIDRSGLPTSLRVRDDWDRHLDPEALGPALLEAYQQAVQSHLAAWGDDLQRSGWKYDAREVDEAPPAEATGEEYRPPVSFSPPRDIAGLVDEVLTELDRSHQLATTPVAPAPQSFRSEGGRVSVEVGERGLTSVHVDGDWAARADVAQLNGELAQSLNAARLRAAETSSPRDLRNDRLDEMLGEITQLMKAQTNGRSPR